MTTTEILDWAESIICSGRPLAHCTQEEWDGFTRKWLDAKHAACGNVAPTPFLAQPATPPLPSGAMFSPDLLARCVMGDAECQIFKTEARKTVLRDEESGSIVTAYIHPDGRILMDSIRPPLSSIGDGKDGISLIAAERGRQIAAEGWTPAHDDDHDAAEMATAAACYALPVRQRSLEDAAIEMDAARGCADPAMPYYVKVRVPKLWPWEPEWWRPVPKDRVSELVKAGALIAAEIDRLNRAAMSAQSPQADAGREEK